jgi:hypothetical protein
MPAAGFDSEEDDAVMLHGTLVCLRDEGGALVVAKRAPDGGWELAGVYAAEAAASLRAEALFQVLRRGNYLGLQSLGCASARARPPAQPPPARRHL